MDGEKFVNHAKKDLTSSSENDYDMDPKLATEAALMAEAGRVVQFVPHWRQMAASTVTFEIHGKNGEVKGVHLTVRTKYGS